MKTIEELEQNNEQLREELGVLYWKVKDIFTRLEQFMEADARHRIKLAVASAREKYKSVKVEGMPVDELELTARTHNVLKSSDIYTVDQLITYSFEELIKLPLMGRKAMNEIRDVLAAQGLKLREEE